MASWPIGVGLGFQPETADPKGQGSLQDTSLISADDVQASGMGVEWEKGVSSEESVSLSPPYLHLREP